MKKFKLVKNGAFGNYYIENINFTPESYELETYGVEEYYIDDVIFTGTIQEIIHFFVEHQKDSLMEGWEVDVLSTQNLKWINNKALSLICQYKHLVGEISEC